MSEKNLGAYAYSKLICERELENRATENNRLVILRLGIIYALEDDRCNSFINKVLESQRKGKEFICKSGESARRYVGINQVCEEIVEAILENTKQKSRILDIQGPDLLKNKDILELVSQMTGDFKYRIESDDINEEIRDIKTSSKVLDVKYSFEKVLEEYRNLDK